MDVGKRKRLIRMLHVDANLTELSPHFVQLDVTLFTPTQRMFTMILHRARGSKQYWTTQEDETLRAMFASIDESGNWTASKDELMEALPTHSWVSICFRGHKRLGVRRTASDTDTLTYTDLAIMRDYGARIDVPVWTTRYDIPNSNEYANVPGLFWVANRERVLHIIR
jgi:hypothetical protein